VGAKRIVAWRLERLTVIHVCTCYWTNITWYVTTPVYCDVNGQITTPISDTARKADGNRSRAGMWRQDADAGTDTMHAVVHRSYIVKRLYTYRKQTERRTDRPTDRHIKHVQRMTGV